MGRQSARQERLPGFFFTRAGKASMGIRLPKGGGKIKNAPAGAGAF
jgi:hypothetical protein